MKGRQMRLILAVLFAVGTFHCSDSAGKITVYKQAWFKHICGRRFWYSPFATRTKRISGGMDVSDARYPWTVAVVGPKTHCSGTLLSGRYVLTAAHCLHETTFNPFRCNITLPIRDILVYPGSFAIYTGDHANVYPGRKILKAKIHPEFLCGSNYRNLAIMELSRPVKVVGRPVCLPNEDELVEKGGKLTATGFDYEQRQYGDKYQLRVINLTVANIDSINSELHVGASQGGVCSSDSGGPLFRTKDLKSTLLGITSSPSGCKTDRHYGLLTEAQDVRKNLDWICSITGLCDLKDPSTEME